MEAVISLARTVLWFFVRDAVQAGGWWGRAVQHHHQARHLGQAHHHQGRKWPLLSCQAGSEPSHRHPEADRVPNQPRALIHILPPLDSAAQGDGVAGEAGAPTLPQCFS